jgi:hypothetical protein
VIWQHPASRLQAALPTSQFAGSVCKSYFAFGCSLLLVAPLEALNERASQIGALFNNMEMHVMNVRSITGRMAILGLSVIGLGIALPAAAMDSRPQTATYVEMQDYLPTWQEQNAWRNTRYALKREFNDVCGDTFCSGEYTNIESLNYRCSVNTSTGIIGECVWVFAASEEDIDPNNGKVVVKPRVWQCVSPLAPSTSAQELVAVLANNRNPMQVTLPRTGTNLHESLSDCLY